MADERRYNEKEVAEIVRLATEGRSAPANDGMTLAEIQAVVSELGLDAISVQDAAEKVRAGLPETHEKGSQFEFLRTYDGEIDDAAWEEIVLLLRRRMGIQGTVTERGATREWSAGEAGTTHVTATVKDGRTRIRLVRDVSDGIVLMWIASILPFIFGPVILMAAGAKWGIPRPWPLIIAGILAFAIVAGVTAINRRQKNNTRKLGSILDEIEPLIKPTTSQVIHSQIQEQEDSPRLHLGQAE